MKEYSVSPQEAQELRAEAKALRERIEELANQWAEAEERSEKAAVTRERKPLEARLNEVAQALKEAPPEPMSLEEAKALLAAHLGKVREDYETKLEKFLENAARSPKNAVEWVEGLIKAEVIWRASKPILEAIGQDGADVATVRLVYEERMEFVKRDFFSRAGNIASATDAFTRAVDIAETEALRDMVPGSSCRSFVFSWLEYQLEDYGERVEVWNEHSS